LIYHVHITDIRHIRKMAPHGNRPVFIGDFIMEKTILYYEQGGEEHTDETLAIARSRAEQLGIHQIVVASTHGYTAKRARAIFEGYKARIIAVSISASFDEEGWTMIPDERLALQKLGIEVLTSVHTLGDDVSAAFSPTAPNAIVRETLYTFCQGMKVAVEVALMAADAGLLNMSQEAIAIAGTGSGADTAIVIQPAYSRKFQKLQIREILAKPR
jgi:hypothetical protein